MSSQPPGGDPPTDPPAPEPPPPAQPGIDTERVTPPPTDAPRGVISAAPVGWTGPDPRPTAPPDGPVVDWAPPVAAAPAARIGEGLVIAGTFSRLVAFAIDAALLGAISLSVTAAIGLYDPGRDASIAVVVGLVLLAVDGAYFVGLWRSGWQATIGMRLIGLRLLSATDATTLSLDRAVIRWFALTGALQLVALIPALAGLALLWLIWELALLLTTATDRLHQGIHDKWAGSVVVQPAPGGSGAAVIGCLVLIFLAFALPFAALALSGDAIREILSRVGESI
jgi:uncharacterized RDD family membrane protein YckC